MIRPQTRVQEILLNNPDLALPLFDVLVFMASPGSSESAEYDEMLDMVYVHTSDFRRHRTSYEKERAAA